MKRALLAPVLVALLTLAGCGSSTDSTASADPTTTPTTTPTTEAPTPKTATEVAEAIKAGIPEISKVVTITEDNDPNDKIGRPNGYVDGAVLFDSRAGATDTDLGVAQGATLEVWPDKASATDRSEFIQGALKEADGFLGTEYHYQSGGYLLRVYGEIKPSDAKVYEQLFNQAMGD